MPDGRLLRRARIVRPMNMKVPMGAGGPVIALLLVWVYAQMQGAEFGWLFLTLAVVFAVAGTLWPDRFTGPRGGF